MRPSAGPRLGFATLAILSLLAGCGRRERLVAYAAAAHS
jgi:hypothetical protein